MTIETNSEPPTENQESQANEVEENESPDKLIPKGENEGINTIVSETEEIQEIDSEQILAGDSASPAAEVEILTEQPEPPIETDAPISGPTEQDTILNDIAASLSALEKKADTMQSDFQSKLKYDAYKDKIIDTLHAELQRYKNDLLTSLLRPIYMDIIELVDDTRKLLKDLDKRDASEQPEQMKKIITNFPGDLEDLLYKHTVEIAVSDATLFNPTVQKAIKVVPTDDEALDKTICERIKNGYSLNGKLIRHEIVSVYQFLKKEP